MACSMTAQCHPQLQEHTELEESSSRSRHMPPLCSVIDGNYATSSLFAVPDGVKLSPKVTFTKGIIPQIYRQLQGLGMT